jgi:rRNA maturation protein Nop10
MATARFAPCPHCDARLSYLQGVTGSTMKPKCPRCGEVVVVSLPTFLMADNSRPAPVVKFSK